MLLTILPSDMGGIGSIKSVFTRGAQKLYEKYYKIMSEIAVNVFLFLFLFVIFYTYLCFFFY